MDLVFLSPGWLILLALAPIPWFWPRVKRRRSLALIRALVLAFAVIGLARPTIGVTDQSEHAVYVLDLSDSVDATARNALVADVEASRRALPGDVRASLVMIGGGNPPAGFDSPQRVASDAQGSRIGAALRAAVRSIPAGARGSITLASDGLATERDWGDALVEIEERKLPLHVIPLAHVDPGVIPVSLTSRQLLRAGHACELFVDLFGDGDEVRVALRGPDGVLGQPQTVAARDRTHLRFVVEPPAPGFLPIEVEVARGDATRRLRRLFAVQPPLEVLYVGARVQEGLKRFGELVGTGFRFTAPASTDAPQPADLSRYDLVVVDDQPRAGFPAGFENDLVAAVRDRGLGVFACGGEAAFGPGGWDESPIADVLPVEARQKEEKRDPSTTLVLILDASGSMIGERIQLAKEVARLAMNRLLPHDKVGIVEFYGTKHWAAPIQPASNAIDLQRALNRLDAGGGTVILPAIEEAFYGLQNVQTRYKHVLCLTDGGVENGAFEPLLRRMADEGINVSTVLIGAETHSEFLVNIANWGRGRFYAVPDRFNLPEILLKQPTSSRLPAYTPGNFGVSARGGTGWWGEVTRAPLPAIGGFVETAARPGSEVLIELDGSHAPLLATWRFGLGQVTTFATEPAGPGTQSWKEWPDFGTFFGRVLARTADDGRSPFDFRLERHGTRVDLLARRRRPSELRPAAQRIDESGSTIAALAFDERADGWFTSSFDVDAAQDVRVQGAAATAAGEPVASAAISFAAAGANEDRFDENGVDPDLALDLPRAAESTSGDVVALSALQSFRPRASATPPPQKLVDLAPYAFMLALAAYVYEIYRRRRAPRDGA